MFKKKEKVPKPPKEKKPGFLKKLKTKIDVLFENDDLTTLGKFLMLSVYGMVSSVVGIVVLSVVGSILSSLCELSGLKSVSLFGGGLAILWIVFIFSFAFAVTMVIIDACGIEEGNDSILTLPPKKTEG